MSKRYRVNSFIPPQITGLDRIYFVEEQNILGLWKTVHGVRGKTRDEAMEALRRHIRTEEPMEFEA